MRATELGVQCLLVADEGVLWTLHRAAARAAICPADTTLKVSALIGPVNPAAYAVYERLGADSINVPSDLTLDHLTEIRRVSRAPRWTCTSRPPTTSAATSGCTRPPS